MSGPRFVSVNCQFYRVLGEVVLTPVYSMRKRRWQWGEPSRKDPNLPEAKRLARLGQTR